MIPKPPSIYNGSIVTNYDTINVRILPNSEITGNFTTWKQPIDYSGYQITSPLEGKNVIANGSPTEFPINTRILLNNQLNPIQNGIYIIQESVWIRSNDLPENSHAAGTITYSKSELIWYFCSSVLDIVGVDNLTFVELNTDTTMYYPGGEFGSIQYFANQIGNYFTGSEYLLFKNKDYENRDVNIFTIGPKFGNDALYSSLLTTTSNLTFESQADMIIGGSISGLLSPYTYAPSSITISCGTSSLDGQITLDSTLTTIETDTCTITSPEVNLNSTGTINVTGAEFSNGGMTLLNSGIVNIVIGANILPKNVLRHNQGIFGIVPTNLLFCNIKSTTSPLIPLIQVYNIQAGQVTFAFINSDAVTTITSPQTFQVEYFIF